MPQKISNVITISVQKTYKKYNYPTKANDITKCASKMKVSNMFFTAFLHIRATPPVIKHRRTFLNMWSSAYVSRVLNYQIKLHTDVTCSPERVHATRQFTS